MNEMGEFIPPHSLSTPVLFLIFNRPDTTQRVFDEIRKAQPPQLFVAADGPRKDRPADCVTLPKNYHGSKDLLNFGFQVHAVKEG